MDKFRILIADDEDQGQLIIKDYIFSYFKTPDVIEVDDFALAIKAIEKIKRSDNQYDFVFTDLEFDSIEDKDSNGVKMTGKDVIIAAFDKYERHQSRFFTVSGRKGTAKILELERQLLDLNIHFIPLVKDEESQRITSFLASELKKWTQQVLTFGISRSDRKQFIDAIQKKAFDRTFKVFGIDRRLSIVLIYWFNKMQTPTVEMLLEEFPNSFLDLPNISVNKLFHSKGLMNITGALIDYYQNFYNSYDGHLDELLLKAKGYLDELLDLYNSIKIVKSDSFDTCGETFKADFKKLHDKIRKEKTELQGKLESPEKEYEMIKFMNRLWLRVFCVGAYFINISTMDIYKLLCTDSSLKNDKGDENNFKIFSRSLWLDSFTQKIDVWSRGYFEIWQSLSQYEKKFIKKWLNDIHLNQAVFMNINSYRYPAFFVDKINSMADNY